MVVNSSLSKVIGISLCESRTQPSNYKLNANNSTSASTVPRPLIAKEVRIIGICKYFVKIVSTTQMINLQTRSFLLKMPFRHKKIFFREIASFSDTSAIIESSKRMIACIGSEYKLESGFFRH